MYRREAFKYAFTQLNCMLTAKMAQAMYHDMTDYCSGFPDGIQQLADVLLFVDDEVFPAHSFVLAAYSPVLCTVLKATAASSNVEFQGRTCTRVPLLDNPKVVQCALTFLYSGCRLLSSSKLNFDLEQLEDAGHIAAAATAAGNLATFADKYAMDNVLKECEVYLVDQVLASIDTSETATDTVLECLLTAEACGLTRVVATCEQMIINKYVLYDERYAQLATRLSKASMRRVARGLASLSAKSPAKLCNRCHRGYNSAANSCKFCTNNRFSFLTALDVDETCKVVELTELVQWQKESLS